jgi:hypothetical protein
LIIAETSSEEDELTNLEKSFWCNENEIEQINEHPGLSQRLSLLNFSSSFLIWSNLGVTTFTAKKKEKKKKKCYVCMYV